MTPQDAKKIIDCLADGADPTTGEVLPPESPFNNPQVIRALFVASEALGRRAEREERVRNLPSNAGQPWSETEDQDLIADFDKGLPVEQLAAKHGRTEGGIASRLVRLGRIKERDDVYRRTPPAHNE